MPVTQIKPLRLTWYFLSVLLSTGCSVFGAETVEEAPFEVVEKQNNFEIRDYASLVVVETEITADYSEAGNQAFRKLFRYISGNNESKAKIAMTAPVISESSGEKIAMTAPVTYEIQGDTWLYQFVLPESYTLDTAPTPLDPTVSLAVVPKRRVASLRYSGRSTKNAQSKNAQSLLKWIDTEGLTPTSAVRWAGYNAPWTLPPFRRNEVLIDIANP